ncbi:phytanoyl-CoA dioxygenase [Nakamurella antarctica]|uniref:Phytanoyl-CoA dioxygenase n=1 Tax=Nakamurella antarctica TaxID=1902245 RepID=A0A3G8ZUA2_9ACTN|nr:phytanoyl-CoA dioxygenase family protein [Nakamurella antarctica]AZI58054.1 phytanoyl-CoA dioxygenase [Nakamurella antarctica]
MTYLTAEQIETYRRDGVVLVRGALNPAEVATAAEGIDFVLAHPGPLSQVASRPGDPGTFTEDFCRWTEVPHIAELATSSGVPALAAQLLDTPRVRLYHDHVLVKEGGTTQRTPWHQDQPYYNVDGRGVSAWIPVDPVPEAGCLELVARTHVGPWLMPRTFLAGEAKWFPEGSLAELPDIEADRAGFEIRRYEMQPGDAIFFDFLTVHGAPGFPFGGRRRVLSLRYLSDAARHAPRRWRTSPHFEGMETQIEDGAEMDHALFPVVWPRS